MKPLAYLATIPRSGTWFLRFSVAFLCHLQRGGCVKDRVSGEVFGDASGPEFDFEKFKGGPIFRVSGIFPFEHLFIGHAICPGFRQIAGELEWWSRIEFHAPGFDYFRQDFNYGFVPVDLADYENTNIDVEALDEMAWLPDARPMALSFRNPLDQAASYYSKAQTHVYEDVSTLNGCPVAKVPFQDYLFEHALPSYAKLFASFQTMAKRRPDRILLVPYERLIKRPEYELGLLLDFLARAPIEGFRWLKSAVFLARSEHLKKVESEMGRSLTGLQRAMGSHIRHGGNWKEQYDRTIQEQAMSYLQSLGIDTALFVWPYLDPQG